jgi:hypothetical protein
MQRFVFSQASKVLSWRTEQIDAMRGRGHQKIIMYIRRALARSDDAHAAMPAAQNALPKPIRDRGVE